MKLKTLSLALSFIFALTACQQDPQAWNNEIKEKKVTLVENKNKHDLESVTNQSLNEQKAKLQELTANKSCDTSAQCQVIAVGSRACGGPSQYAIYSNKNVNSDTVQTLASDITVAEKVFNEKNNMMSICQHLEEPAAQCINNQCTKSLKNGDIY